MNLTPEELSAFQANSIICEPLEGARITRQGCLARRKRSKKPDKFNPYLGKISYKQCRTCEQGEKLEETERERLLLASLRVIRRYLENMKGWYE